MKKILFISLILILVGCTKEPPTTCFQVVTKPLIKPPEEVTQDDMELTEWYAGLIAMEAIVHEYESAFEQAELALEYDPYYYLIYFHLGIVYYEIGETEKAFENILTAIILFPYDYKFLSSFFPNEPLLVYTDMNDCLDRAIQSNPRDASNYVNRGLFFFILGYPDKSLDDYDVALELDNSFSDAYYYRSLALMNLNRYEDALGSVTQAIHFDNKNPKYFELQGRLHWVLEENFLAEKSYSEMLSLCKHLRTCKRAEDLIEELHDESP